ncbi:Na+/H+ antiporter subunit E [Acuticoccus sp. I52.16.1]|uniref:Na+/H+ antiporter subunit E n=1 Tax=Acuticoccus sp. I52.16.1 TaxID=2928472 RepID=UPI001FD4F0B3|nr:Na+/H+ antiporter subunit E [Acuticoccus sp. I52.16.1]UOM34344.1 Na+/H+ antiporter subunit E [Acuticoccus sp. I52.16.1]
MSTILLNVFLAFAWVGMTGHFGFANLAFGFVLGGLALAMIRNETGTSHHFLRALLAVRLALIFVFELIKSSVNVAAIVLSPSRELQPAIIAYPLDVMSPAEITLLANMITLTPGTLSVDVSDDQSTLYIHAIDAPDPEAVVRDTKASFEKHIKRVFAA